MAYKLPKRVSEELARRRIERERLTVLAAKSVNPKAPKKEYVTNVSKATGKTFRTEVKTYTDLQDKVHFGKYKGFTINAIVHSDPAYLLWAHENVDYFWLSPDMLEEAKAMYQLIGNKNGGRNGT